MGSTRVAAPPPRNYGEEMRSTLQAQVDMAPELYASEAEYQPKYQDLNLANLERALLGTDDQRGVIAQYEEDLYPALSRIEADSLSKQRAADIGAVEQYGTRASAALRSAAGNQQIIDELGRQALEEVQAGQSLTPGELRQAQQSSRAAMSSRGLGMGNQAIADEVLRNYQLGRQRQAERRQFAGGVAGLQQQTGADPFMAILGRPSQAMGMGQGVAGAATGMAPGRQFNPLDPYAGSLYASNQQNEMAARQATAAGRSGVMGGGLSALGNIGAGLAIAGCWVAREVYGNENPRWIQFFIWKELEAPKWFSRAYDRFGERIASFIKDKPRLKNIIRNWMDSKIKG